MPNRGHFWAIILAAGEGTRLRSLTRDQSGIPVPKQFCSFLGDQSMLRCARERAGRVVSPERIVTIVAREQERWWEREFEGGDREHLIVQPRNAGTAAGLLLPLFHVFLRDPLATVLVLPSDHFVGDEGVLEKALRRSLTEAEHHKKHVILLGIEPENADSGYGWIVPAGRGEPDVRNVRTFVEKPSSVDAARLMRQGALWNSFMFAASAGLLLKLYQDILPELFRPFLAALREVREPWTNERLDVLYAGLPVRDFSRDLLEKAVPSLRLIDVPHCGWSDLGTPERVERCLDHCERDLERGVIEKARERLLRVPEAPPTARPLASLNGR